MTLKSDYWMLFEEYRKSRLIEAVYCLRDCNEEKGERFEWIDQKIMLMQGVAKVLPGIGSKNKCELRDEELPIIFRHKGYLKVSAEAFTHNRAGLVAPVPYLEIYVSFHFNDNNKSPHMWYCDYMKSIQDRGGKNWDIYFRDNEKEMIWDIVSSLKQTNGSWEDMIKNVCT